MKTKTKTKIVFGAVAVIAVVAVALLASNGNFFKGSMGRVPFPKGGRLPMDTRGKPSFEKAPVFNMPAESDRYNLVAFCSATPPVFDPMAGERARISCTINEELPDGIVIYVWNPAASPATARILLSITTAVATGNITTEWDGLTPAGFAVGSGIYQYVVRSGDRNLSGGNIEVRHPEIIPVEPSFLTLIKVVVNAGGGISTVADFPLFINDMRVFSGSTTALAPGTYVAREITRSGYRPVAWSTDCAADGRVTINAGDNKVCVITNIFVPEPEGAPTLTHEVTPPVIDPTLGEIARIYYNVVGTFFDGLVSSIRDSSGRTVRNLVVLTTAPTGEYIVYWDGRNNVGEIVPNGIYQYVFTSGAREIASGAITVATSPRRPTIK